MDFRAIKYEADQTLQRDIALPRRIVLIHTGLSLGLSLLLAFISFCLDRVASGDGGLSGLGTQAALSTAQVVIQLASLVVVPFWQAGLTYTMLGYVRGRAVQSWDLAEGFRRFAPILTSSLMMGLQYMARAVISMYLTFTLITLTPFTAPLYQVSGMLEQNPNLDILALNVPGMGIFFGALVVIYVLVFVALAAPVFYRYRMVNYIIMDDQNIGGFKAMFLSRIMMHRRRRKLFRLDLSFWWFYGLELLLTAISLGTLLLPLAGITLPVSDDAAYWIFQIICVFGQLGLYYWAKPKLEVAYALCYEEFGQNAQPPTTSRAPQVHPWED